jgi:hypothetical protein
MAWLRRVLWNEEGRTVSGDVLATAMGTLAAHAEHSGKTRELFVRSAWREGTLYVELRPGQVVRVEPRRDGAGWRIDPDPPVLFRQYPNARPLPDPVPGGNLDGLVALTNVKLARHKRLLHVYIETAYLEHSHRPILDVNGAMGSGKTTLCWLIKRLSTQALPRACAWTRVMPSRRRPTARCY